jgi:hypothetical protein
VARSEIQEEEKEMSQGNILLHCGGQPATFTEICRVALPEQTNSYRPVPHGDLVRLLKEEVATRIGLADPVESYGINREGKQLFGTLAYELPEGPTRADVDLLGAFGQEIDRGRIRSEYGYTIAFRNSYDKSMGLGIVGGVTTFICDNLCISGSDFTIKLPHTPGVWARAVPEVMVKVKDSVGQFEHSIRFLERLKGIQLSQNRCYEVIGLGMGQGVLTASQANETFRENEKMRRDWSEGKWEVTTDGGDPAFEGLHDFAAYGGSAYGLYQNFTQGLKLGQNVSRRIDRYTGASRLFEREILVN